MKSDVEEDEDHSGERFRVFFWGKLKWNSRNWHEKDFKKSKIEKNSIKIRICIERQRT